jgi:hypothetical protein
MSVAANRPLTMAAGTFDFAILGASPFALLLAGLLRSAHGKSVVVVADPWSAYRLARGFDLSVMPATRPETWALLKRGATETTRFLGAVGKNLYERVDPLFVADTEASADRLGHMRWMAFGLGFAAERAIDRGIAVDGTICRIRDAVMLIGGSIEPALEGWLGKLGVRHLPARETTLSFPRGVHPVISSAGETLGAETAVLADDDAILTHLAPADRLGLLTVTPRTSLITEPAKPLGAALIHYLDRDVILHQHQTRGPISAIAGGEADVALPRIAAGLRAQGQLRRSGQALIRTVGTADGAPLIGPMGKGKPTVIAGLGPSAAFFAPTVARVLANAAGEDEKRYFELRETSRATNRQSIAEGAPTEMAS